MRLGQGNRVYSLWRAMHADCPLTMGSYYGSGSFEILPTMNVGNFGRYTKLRTLVSRDQLPGWRLRPCVVVGEYLQ